MAKTANILIADTTGWAHDAVKESLKIAGVSAAVHVVASVHDLLSALSSGPWDLVLVSHDSKVFPWSATIRSFDSAVSPSRVALLVQDRLKPHETIEVLRSGYHDIFIADDLFRIGPIVERNVSLGPSDLTASSKPYLPSSSEDSFRALVEASTQHFWIAQKTGESAELFAVLSKICGVEIRSIGDVHSHLQDDAAVIAEEWKRCFKTRSLFDRVCRMQRSDGSLAYLAVRAIPTFNADGSFRNWSGSLTDISERMIEQEALRISEERFRDLFENANDLIYTHDLKGRFTSLNRAGELITGYSREEAMQLNIRDVVAPDYMPKATEMINAKLAGQPATSYETEIITKQGQTVVLDLSTRLIYENGVPVRVQGIARDVTEKKQTETAIKSSEKHLRIITDTVPVSIAKITSDMTVMFANRSFLEWLGKPAERVVGFPLREIVGDAAFEGARPEFDQVLAGRALSVEREVFLDPAETRKGDPKRHVRMNYVPEFDENGDVESFFAFMTDLTELKQSEIALRKNEEQLLQSQKLESIGRLAGGIAHDFNNMLTAINGYSDLTLRRMLPSDPLRRNIEEIRKAGERSADLTNQLLAFSRRQILQPSVLDLNIAVADLVPMLERLIGADVELKTNYTEDGVMVSADPGQLSQVLLNLIINARDSMPNGGIIEVSTKRVRTSGVIESPGGNIHPGEYCVMAISDTGVGMEENILKQIFEPFFTTKEIGKGTGLGLSTVHGIVLQSGGNIAVRSRVGVGSCFEIYLPAISGKDDSHRGQAAYRSNAFAFGSEFILLVEDEATVRDLGREILESCGYRVMTASDGVEGLKLLDQNHDRIKLLMTDIVMPNMGGRELAETAAKRYPGLKILYSSGYDDQAIGDKGSLIAGPNFIQKPFTFDALAVKIREILDSSDE